MSAVPKTLVTPDDLLRMPDSSLYELVNGKLVERNVGAISSWVSGQLFRRVDQYNDLHKHGWTFPADASLQCYADAPNKIRRADLCFFRFGRFLGEQLPAGHIRIVPDLVAEVVSPNDLASEVDAKVREYIAAGVRLVWVINPEVRVAHVFRADGSSQWLLEQAELDGEDVLPGFRVAVRDLLPPAPPVGDAS